MKRLTRNALTALASALVVLPQGSTQSSQKKRASTAKSQTDLTTSRPVSESAGAASTGGFTDAALKTVAAPQDGGDYVPCKFTYAQLQSLVLPERKPALTPADAEKFVQSVIQETKRQQQTSLIDNETAQAILATLNPDSFAGLSPSEAMSLLQRVLSVVRNVAAVQSSSTQAVNLLYDISVEAKDVPSKINALKQGADRSLRQAVADANLIPRRSPSSMQAFDIDTLIKGARESQTVFDPIAKLSPADVETLRSNPVNYYGSSSAEQIQRTLTYRFGTPTESNNPSDISATNKIKSALNAKASDPGTAQGLNNIAGISDIAAKAQTSLDLLVRPIDVGCAMSVLSGDETSRAYGRLVANRYVAIQIVVRNLNRDQEFILHDSELAVAVDPGGLLGRFYTGRDKTIVRQISVLQQYFDARNIVIHVAEGIGAIMSSSALVFGGALSDASDVYVGGFFPSLSKGWRDVSVDQLNLLSDTGFSSRSNSQIVVPKTGSVMFVMFVPSRQFEQAWWAQPCATRLTLGPYADLNSRELVPLTKNEKVVGDDALAATGYDVHNAVMSCKLGLGYKKQWTYNPFSAIKSHSKGKVDLDKAAYDGFDQPSGASATDQRTILLTPNKVPFNKWTGNSIAIFQELATAVVAGIHIVNDKDLAPSVSDLGCGDKDSSGRLKWPDPSTKQLSCTMTGKNLDKISSVRLRNFKDNVDANIAESSEVKLSGGDNSSASVVFSTDALHKLSQPDYGVYAAKKMGAEVKTDVVIHFDNGPWLSGIEPSQLDPTTAPKQIIVSGYHLGADSVKSLTIKGQSKTVTLSKLPAPVSTDEKLYFTGPSATDWQAFSKDQNASLILVMIDGSPTTLTGPLAAYLIKAPVGDGSSEKSTVSTTKDIKKIAHTKKEAVPN